MWYKHIKQPILALAPMASMTDGPFCRVCREVESLKSKVKSFVIFREMVSAEAIVRGNEKTLKMCEFTEGERPIVQQIFGATPEVMVEATKIIVEKFKPDGIDINMGCPVPKIAGKAGSGAALMKDPERAYRIVTALKQADLGVPISVKTRLGWIDNTDILDFAVGLEKAGADVITIHGRTRSQGYSGVADWDMIRQVKSRVSIPVIANGDVTSQEDIERCLKVTGADGIMIGRGALGNPWIFCGTRNEERGTEISMSERIDVVLHHARYHIERYGEDRGLVTFRKHLLYYFKGIPGVKELKQELVKVTTMEELEKILSKLE